MKYVALRLLFIGDFLIKPGEVLNLTEGRGEELVMTGAVARVGSASGEPATKPKSKREPKPRSERKPKPRPAQPPPLVQPTSEPEEVSEESTEGTTEETTEGECEDTSENEP